jgi:hypothetical protein
VNGLDADPPGLGGQFCTPKHTRQRSRINRGRAQTLPHSRVTVQKVRIVVEEPMASLDIKQVEPLIKEFSPPEEVKRTFYQTLFGSLMGQTFFFMGLLAIYFAIVALLNSYAKAPLQAFHEDFGPIWFWSMLAVPLG